MSKFNFTKAAIAKLPIPSKRAYYRDSKESLLGLYITPNDARVFCAVFYARGKDWRISLGRFPGLSIPLARLGMARRGLARRGKAGRGKARLGAARLGLARPGAAGQGKARAPMEQQQNGDTHEKT